MADSPDIERPSAQPAAPARGTKTLSLRQAWFLGAMALAVGAFFVFIILPYVEPKPTVSGRTVADFDLELLSGGNRGDRVRLSDLKGKKVVLDFWASWCLPCREQARVLAELAPLLGPDVVVLGIATSDGREDASRFLEEHRPPYSNAFDETGELARSLEVKELPTLLVLDKRGTLRGASTRPLLAREIRSMVEAAE